MKREFVVADEAGNISWNANKEAPEKFKTFKSARARGEGLAKLAPGCTIRIYELTAEIVVPLKSVQTSRRHPLEHYR